MSNKPLIKLVFLAALFLAGCTSNLDANLPPTETPSPAPSFNLDEHIDNGSALMDQTKYNEAEILFQDAISYYPDSALAYASLAEAILKQDTRHQTGFEAAQKAISLDPNNGFALRVLSAYQSKLLLLEDSYTDAEAAYQQYPDDPVTAHTLIQAALGVNHNEKALEVLRGVREKYPADPETYTLIGLYYARTAQFERSDAAYRKAVALDPANIDNLVNYAWLNLLQIVNRRNQYWIAIFG